MFATHVLAPFALIAQLSPLEAAAPSRVIIVSSGGMFTEELPPDDFESEGTGYNAKKLYARTKREQVVIGELWAERLQARGVFVHSIHPGWADTEGVRAYMPRFQVAHAADSAQPEAGASTIVWLGAAPEACGAGADR